MAKRLITNPRAQARATPLSPALEAGAFVFVSGQVGTDPATGELAGDSVETQTQRALDNIRELLEQAGLDMSDVVKTTVFLVDMADFQAMNAVYRESFPEPRPARSTVRADLAAPRYRVEIEAIALRRE